MSWPGQWVESRLGVSFQRVGGEDARALAGLALRRNPRRAHLVVSTVLGKHIPAPPSSIAGASGRLAALVRALPGLGDAVAVVAFAETATALGHLVASGIPGAYNLNSTRAPGPALAEFSEVHSHAAAHYLRPRDPGPLAIATTIVLVDDELTTGRTALAAIDALLPHTACRDFVLAALIDSRSPAERAPEVPAGVTLRSVALADLRLELPADLPERAAPLLSVAQATPVAGGGPARTVQVDARGTVDGRHGFSAEQRDELVDLADSIAGLVDATGPLSVIGTEEFMALPLLVAQALERAGRDVVFGSSTRSPAIVIDEPGYALRTMIAFETGAGQRYLYNVQPDRGAVVITDCPQPGLTAAVTGLGVDCLVIEVQA